MKDEKPLTKKEKRALRKLEKEKERLKHERRKSIKKSIIWLLLIIVGLALLFGLIKLASYEPTSNSSVNKNINIINENDWISGNQESEISLIEYSDFQCPACGTYFPIVKQLVEEFGDQIRLVYRHFPLTQIHQNAQLAAQAAEAAGKQNKFWAMHDVIFENQKEWSEKKNAKELFIQYAQDLSLDVEQFKNDLDSQEVKEKVANDYQSGISAGVNATPTFFLNGKKLKNPRSYKEFKKEIQKILDSTNNGEKKN